MGKWTPPVWKGITPEAYLKRIAPQIIKYCDWYCENGLHLPKGFEADPGAWTTVVREIQLALTMVVNDVNPEDDLMKGLKMRGVQNFYKYLPELLL